jgi:DNA polymerase/3'-5' exonuclease PolX
MAPTNQDISRKLREHASTLAQAGDNLYRIRAYRRAALAVLALPEEVSTIVAGRGREGLAEVPGIGKSLAETIAELLKGDGVRPLAV